MEVKRGGEQGVDVLGGVIAASNCGGGTEGTASRAKTTSEYSVATSTTMSEVGIRFQFSAHTAA